MLFILNSSTYIVLYSAYFYIFCYLGLCIVIPVSHNPIWVACLYLMSSGVSRISFRGGFKIFLEKWGYLHGAKRHAARGEATRLLGGFGGMLPREIFLKWCNLVRFREYLLKFCQKNNLKNSHFLYKNNR